MATVITHPGQAHRDEFVAVSLLFAAGKATRCLRRDPEAHEITDTSTIIVDVGGVNDPGSRTYDHHTRGRQEDARCSITDAIEHELGLDPHTCRQVWKWLGFSELLDSRGPFAAAHEYGVDPSRMVDLISPVETAVLHWFEQASEVDISNPLGQLMEMIGRQLLDYLQKIVERLELLDHAVEQFETEEGVQVADVTWIHRDDNPVLGLEQWLEANAPETAVTITADDRGTGIALFRRGDDPRVDFARLAGEEGVVFAHKGGFVAKLATNRVDEAVAFIKKAIVEEENVEYTATTS